MRKCCTEILAPSSTPYGNCPSPQLRVQACSFSPASALVSRAASLAPRPSSTYTASPARRRAHGSESSSCRAWGSAEYTTAHGSCASCTSSAKDCAASIGGRVRSRHQAKCREQRRVAVNEHARDAEVACDGAGVLWPGATEAPEHVRREGKPTRLNRHPSSLPGTDHASPTPASAREWGDTWLRWRRG